MDLIALHTHSPLLFIDHSFVGCVRPVASASKHSAIIRNRVQNQRRNRSYYGILTYQSAADDIKHWTKFITYIIQIRDTTRPRMEHWHTLLWLKMNSNCIIRMWYWWRRYNKCAYAFSRVQWQQIAGWPLRCSTSPLKYANEAEWKYTEKCLIACDLLMLFICSTFEQR